MGQSPAQGQLAELSRLAAAGRRSRTAVWFPLLVFAAVSAIGVPIVLVIGRERFGAYMLPAHVAAGIASAWHFRRAGATTGLQAPLFVWLGCILAATIVAAACSKLGRDAGWDALNLAGPSVAMMAGYGVLAAWSRSTVLLVLVAGIGVTAAIAVRVLRGDEAIALQVGSAALLMLALAAFNFAQLRRAL